MIIFYPFIINMRNKNGRFTKKDAIKEEEEEEEEEEMERIKEFEYTDLWIYKVVDAFTKALIGLLLRLAIQIFFILLFAMLLKKIGLMDLLKEIFNMITIFSILLKIFQEQNKMIIKQRIQMVDLPKEKVTLVNNILNKFT